MNNNYDMKHAGVNSRRRLTRVGSICALVGMGMSSFGFQPRAYADELTAETTAPVTNETNEKDFIAYISSSSI